MLEPPQMRDGAKWQCNLVWEEVNATPYSSID